MHVQVVNHNDTITTVVRMQQTFYFVNMERDLKSSEVFSRPFMIWMLPEVTYLVDWRSLNVECLRVLFDRRISLYRRSAPRPGSWKSR